MPLTKKYIVTLLALCFPILSPLSADDHAIQPVSFQPSVSEVTLRNILQPSTCPDLYQAGAEASTICAISGVVDQIQLGQNDRIAWVVIRIGQQDFYYFPKGNDTALSLGLFTASKIHQIPVSLRYQNWGGRQYITEANF